MNTYNKIMLYFWLVAGIIMLVGVSYYAITEGFAKWRYYFIFPALALVMFFMRKYMMKRFEKHNEWLANQEKNDNQSSAE